LKKLVLKKTECGLSRFAKAKTQIMTDFFDFKIFPMFVPFSALSLKHLAYSLKRWRAQMLPSSA
jgi:hypothetical protein